MIRIALAAAAALALSFAAPAFAGGCDDCKDCPHKVTASAEKKDGEAKAVTCPCGDGKECKCGATCQCPHCAAKKAAKKDETKKT